MKALVLEAYNQLVVREVPEPEPQAGEVLVEIEACGLKVMIRSNEWVWDLARPTARRVEM